MASLFFGREAWEASGPLYRANGKGNAWLRRKESKEGSASAFESVPAVKFSKTATALTAMLEAIHTAPDVSVIGGEPKDIAKAMSKPKGCLNIDEAMVVVVKLGSTLHTVSLPPYSENAQDARSSNSTRLVNNELSFSLTEIARCPRQLQFFVYGGKKGLLLAAATVPLCIVSTNGQLSHVRLPVVNRKGRVSGSLSIVLGLETSGASSEV